MPALHAFEYMLGTPFTCHVPGCSPHHNSDNDNHGDIMAALDAIGARLASRTRRACGSARDPGRPHVRGLYVPTQSVHVLLDGLQQLFQLGGAYATPPPLLTPSIRL